MNAARRLATLGCAVLMAAVGCSSRPAPIPPTAPTPPQRTSHPVASAAATPAPASTGPPRREGRGETAVVVGTPVELAGVAGRIVFDDFEDVYTMNADGSGLATVAGRPGPEFDGVWSPDGQFIAVPRLAAWDQRGR